MPLSTDSQQTDGHYSKTLAALLALVAGTIGAHSLYLGNRHWWLYPLVSMPMLAWALSTEPWYLQWPFFFAALVTVWAMLQSIRIALTPDEKWDARFNPEDGARSNSGVGVVLVAIVALMLGAVLLMSLLAIFQQKLLESLL